PRLAHSRLLLARRAPFSPLAPRTFCCSFSRRGGASSVAVAWSSSRSLLPHYPIPLPLPVTRAAERYRRISHVLFVFFFFFFLLLIHRSLVPRCSHSLLTQSLSCRLPTRR